MKQVALALFPLMFATAPAIGAECMTFSHEVTPEVRITIGDQTVEVSDRGDVSNFQIGTTKPYGQLIDVALEGMEVDAVVHYYQITEINGRRALIYDSQIFLPACD